MRLHRLLFVAGILATGAALEACARPPDTTHSSADARRAPSADAPSRAKAVGTPAAPPAATRTHILVHKSPSCGCCSSWVEHLRRSGFVVDVRNVDDLGPIKARVGVPYGKGACHTAEVGGYFIEGHVPADDIRRLLSERPAGKGLTLPGMPAGSPGMEMPDGRIEPFVVELVTPSGATVPYARHHTMRAATRNAGT